jgi:hypothetical protein
MTKKEKLDLQKLLNDLARSMIGDRGELACNIKSLTHGEFTADFTKFLPTEEECPEVL